MEITLAAKIRILNKAEQTTALQATLDAYRRGCNWVSQIVYDTQNLHQASLHDRNYYHRLRTEYGPALPDGAVRRQDGSGVLSEPEDQRPSLDPDRLSEAGAGLGVAPRLWRFSVNTLAD